MDLPSDKRARIENSFRQDMESFLETALERSATKFNEGWDARLSKIIEQQDAKMDLKMQEQDLKWQQEMTKLSERMDKMREDMESMKNSASVGSTVDPATSGRRGWLPHEGPPGAWKPRKIDIKGFVTNWQERDLQALSQVEAEQFLGALQDALEEADAALVDWPTSMAWAKKVINPVITLKMQEETSQQEVWALRATLLKLFENNRELALQKALRCIVEPPQHKVEMLSSGGRALAVISGLGHKVRPMWSRDGQRCSIFVEVPNGRARAVVEWKLDTGFGCHPAACREILNKEPPEVLGLLA